jgi:hypothetical protein
LVFNFVFYILYFIFCILYFVFFFAFFFVEAFEKQCVHQLWLDDLDAGESQLAPSRPGWLDAMDDEAELMTIISDGSSDEGDVVRTREMQSLQARVGPQNRRVEQCTEHILTPIALLIPSVQFQSCKQCLSAVEQMKCSRPEWVGGVVDGA